MISSSARLQPWIELLRWNKPTGRLILLIPAGWALWLNPTAPPSLVLILQILLGGLAVSGAGCIANDLWDQRFDGKVERTKRRPLARGALQRGPAFALLLTLLGLSLAVVLSLPAARLRLCLALACPAVLPLLDATDGGPIDLKSASHTALRVWSYLRGGDAANHNPEEACAGKLADVRRCCTTAE